MHYHIVKEVSDIDGARLVFYYDDEGSPDPDLADLIIRDE
jgi:hypothetical protein